MSRDVMQHAKRYRGIKLKPELGGMTPSVLLKAEQGFKQITPVVL